MATIERDQSCEHRVGLGNYAPRFLLASVLTAGGPVGPLCTHKGARNSMLKLRIRSRRAKAHRV